MTIASAPHWRGTNLDLARLVCAGLVAVYHALLLPGLLSEGSGLRWATETGAALGVQGFFVISGMLVLSSLERSAGLADYAAKRARRLLPAYLAVVVGTVLVGLVLSAELRAHAGEIPRYLFWNLLFANFMDPDLTGLFSANTITAINGSLWTIKIEVGFYLVLPVLWWLARRTHVGLTLLSAGLGAALWPVLVGWGQAYGPLPDQLAHQLPSYLGYFAAGMALWHWRTLWTRRALWMGLGGAALLALSLLTGPEALLRPLALMGIFGAIAFAPWQWQRPRWLGDLSYGLYLVHFPVLQALVAGPLGESPMSAVAGLALSVVLAALLWQWVERPALRSSSHYRRAPGDDRSPGQPSHSAESSS